MTVEFLCKFYLSLLTTNSLQFNIAYILSEFVNPTKFSSLPSKRLFVPEPAAVIYMNLASPFFPFLASLSKI